MAHYKIFSRTQLDTASINTDAAPGATLNTLVENVISPLIRDKVEEFLGRRLTYEARTEIFDSDDSGMLWVNAFPIDTAQTLTVHFDTSIPRTYPADTLLVKNEDYVIYKDRGLIKAFGYGWRPGLKTLKVTWTGGILTADAVPLAAQQATYDAILNPCLMWAKRILTQWERMGVLNESFQGASVGYPPLGWIPTDIKQLLAAQKHAVYGAQTQGEAA